MKFKPQSATQIEEGRQERFKLLDPKATYSFEVYTAVEKKSKSSGNDMFELTLNIESEHGKRQIRDYITCTQEDKLYEFCLCIGMVNKYNSGSLVADDLLGAEGMCRVGIEKGTANGDGGTWPDKNKIARYLPPGTKQTPPATPAAVQDDDDDEIPF